MDKKQALEIVRAKISNPTRWTQGAMARNAVGKSVSALNSTAVCWCLLGAVMAHNDIMYLMPSAGGLVSHLSKTLRIMVGISVPLQVWNDAKERTHAEVLHLLDEAIRTV